ncbi:MAG: hypothetical protein C4519_15675 [Desulfobacteraceae bacterium]|nr:MAG: hypothetical protein C4519_15675 [Desulfobacteraceae bacterium]
MNHLKATVAALFAVFLFVSGNVAQATAEGTEQSLLSFSSGAFVIQKPAEYGGIWSGFWLLDENPKIGWASAKGKIENNIWVIELAEKTLLKLVEFDTAGIDGKGRGAKDVVLEISDEGLDKGYQKIAEFTLADAVDGQRFPVASAVPGRWLKLTVKNNHGAKDYTELMDFRGYGDQLTKTSFPEASGTYATNFNDFHLRQQGTAVTGCYEYKDGLLNGGIEGRILKFTWQERERKGPAIFIFSQDGKQFFGVYWLEGNEKNAGGIWTGNRKSAAIGSCPHWSGGAQEQMSKELQSSGRVRLYGINFDVDSAVLRSESIPTLDKIAGMLKADGGLRLTIEGHTDSSGTGERNQVLSLKRAESVRSYLVAAGIVGDRLKAEGFGSSKPVSANTTALGKAQNRRVELVKQDEGTSINK